MQRLQLQLWQLQVQRLQAEQQQTRCSSCKHSSCRRCRDCGCRCGSCRCGSSNQSSCRRCRDCSGRCDSCRSSNCKRSSSGRCRDCTCGCGSCRCSSYEQGSCRRCSRSLLRDLLIKGGFSGGGARAAPSRPFFRPLPPTGVCFCFSGGGAAPVCLPLPCLWPQPQLGRGGGGLPSHPIGAAAWDTLREEEECIRGCIMQLRDAVLELLREDFREGGLRLSALPPPLVPASLTRPGYRLGRVIHSLRGGGVPSSPPQRFNFCANPPPGCLHCAAPWGTVSICSGKGWGLTPALHCPDPSPLPPRPRGQGAGDGILPPPVFRAPAVCVTGGSIAAAVAAGLAKDGGGGGGTSTFSLRLAPGLTRDFGENSGSLPTAGAMGGLHRCPGPGSGYRGFSWGEGDHNHPLPAWLQPAARGGETAEGGGRAPAQATWRCWSEPWCTRGAARRR